MPLKKIVDLPHARALESLSFSPDRRFLATTDNDVRIWSLTSWKMLRHITTPDDDTCRTVYFLPDSKTLATGTAMEKQLRLYSTDRWAVVNDLQAHRQEVAAITCNTAGSILVTGGGESVVKLWSLPSLGLLKIIPATGNTFHNDDIFFTPDEAYLCTYTKGVVGFRDYKRTGKPVEPYKPIAALHPLRRLSMIQKDNLFVGGDREGYIYFGSWAPTGTSVKVQGHTRPINKVQLSQDGRFCISLGLDNTVKVWDVKTRSVTDTITLEKMSSGEFAISADDSLIAVNAQNDTVTIYKVTV